MNAQLGDRQYFVDEVLRLREFWGKKTFWLDLDKASKAMAGLTIVWLNTKEPSQADERLMRATIVEFEMRLGYAISNLVAKNTV